MADREIEVQFEFGDGNSVVILLSPYTQRAVGDALLNNRIKAVEVRSREPIFKTRAVRFNVT